MVQLFVEMAAPPGRIRDVLDAFQAVMLPARLHGRCACASIWRAPDDERVVRYVEEWPDAADFEREARSERIGRLLEVLEMAERAPMLEVRSIDGIRGLEYLAEVRGAASRPAKVGGGEPPA